MTWNFTSPLSALTIGSKPLRQTSGGYALAMDEDVTIGLEEAYSVKTPEDVRRLYGKWAATYESEFVDKRSYRYPQAIAEIFNDVVPNDGITNVVDIGTGTGLTCKYLAALRPQLTFDGIDISPEMLAQAKLKLRSGGAPVYRDLFEKDLTKSIQGTNAPYDALICSGTFTHGHLGPEAIENLIPLVKQSGWIVFGVNNEHFIARGFAEELARLSSAGQISKPRLERIDVYGEGSIHRGDQARVVICTRM